MQVQIRDGIAAFWPEAAGVNLSRLGYIVELRGIADDPGGEVLYSLKLR